MSRGLRYCYCLLVAGVGGRPFTEMVRKSLPLDGHGRFVAAPSTPYLPDAWLGFNHQLSAMYMSSCLSLAVGLLA